jgi:hypothetical protein
MKCLLINILLFISTFVLAQVDSTTLQFLNGVMKRKNDSATIFYTNKVHSGMYDFMMSKSVIKKTIKDIGGTNKDRLHLTSAEAKLLKQHLIEARDQHWPEQLFTNSKSISVDSTQSFLIQNRDKELYLFSKPVFIRNNTIALFYVVRLCCGGIYGPVDLSFYRKENDGWQRWIRVDGGAF